jgi:histidinol-phosphate aminotransferase
MLAQVDRLREIRDDSLLILRQLGCQVIDSDANFCLFGRFTDRHAVWEALLRRGVLVREIGPAGYLRVSTGTSQEMQRFYAALAEIVIEPGVFVQPSATA